jgi:nucleotide-binding universal stress UspA family protein
MAQEEQVEGVLVDGKLIRLWKDGQTYLYPDPNGWVTDADASASSSSIVVQPKVRYVTIVKYPFPVEVAGEVKEIIEKYDNMINSVEKKYIDIWKNYSVFIKNMGWAKIVKEEEEYDKNDNKKRHATVTIYYVLSNGRRLLVKKERLSRYECWEEYDDSWKEGERYIACDYLNKEVIEEHKYETIDKDDVIKLYEKTKERLLEEEINKVKELLERRGYHIEYNPYEAAEEVRVKYNGQESYIKFDPYDIYYKCRGVYCLLGVFFIHKGLELVW